MPRTPTKRTRSRRTAITTALATIEKPKPQYASVFTLQDVLCRKITPELIKAFCRETRIGMPPHITCDLLGITSSTFTRWLREALLYIEDPTNPDHRNFKISAEFVLQMRKAYAKSRRKLIKRAHDPGNPAWVQCLSILERIEARSYSRQITATSETQDVDPDERFD